LPRPLEEVRVTIISVLTLEIERLRRALAVKRQRVYTIKKSRDYWRTTARTRGKRIYELEKQRDYWKSRA
jgi:hypothetical protein